MSFNGIGNLHPSNNSEVSVVSIWSELVMTVFAVILYLVMVACVFLFTGVGHAN